MKRDMDLVRLILLKVEKEYKDGFLFNIRIDGYDSCMVSNHCKLLYEAGFISDYQSKYADDELCSFIVGDLTWYGHDFLDKIRDNSFWHKTKEVIKKNGLPLIVDTIKTVATDLIKAATEGAVTAYLKNGGQP